MGTLGVPKSMTTKTIDTWYPEYYHSSWLDFEQKHLLGWRITPQDSQEYKYRFTHNQWLARKYSFRSSHLAISQGYSAVGIQWHLGGGCYLLTNSHEEVTQEHGLPADELDNLYLMLAYRHKEFWDGRPLMPRLKAFIKYLEEMPANPVGTIYARATDINGTEKKHLRLTNAIMDATATNERLDRVYRKYFRAVDWVGTQDMDGKPFLKFEYHPKYSLYA